MRYDPEGDLASVVYPNGVTTTYTYNLLNCLTKVAVTPRRALAAYQYALGPTGNRTGVTELGAARCGFSTQALMQQLPRIGRLIRFEDELH